MTCSPGISSRQAESPVLLRQRLQTGVRLVQEVELNPRIPERIRAGEPYDIGLTNPSYATALIDDGLADGGSHRAFGRVSLAVAHKGMETGQMIADSQGIETLLRSAKSIAYTGAGTSGHTYLDVIERMGLTDSVLPQSHAFAGGIPAVSVATGDWRIRTCDCPPHDGDCHARSRSSSGVPGTP